MIALFAAAAVAAAATPDADQRLADLRHIYAQSCAVRGYASFDDLCDLLRKQMRQAERDHRQASRRPVVAAPTTALAEQSAEPPERRD